MFLYLSKKISMPNGLRVSSLSWNSEQGWLACGGETGLLKVLKLEPKASNDNKKSPLIATPSNLSMNQTLEGHHGAVLAVSWNQNYRKLTSSDEKGLIIVWVLHKGMWFEEMVNNREKSVVRDLRWSSDGQKICIVYEDGHVVLGNVHGNRLWGKILEMQLCFCEWSPDCRLILLCTVQGTCQIHDMKGYFVAQLSMCFLDKGFAPTPVIVGIDWYNGLDGHADQNAPTLALALQHGKIQLMRHEMDEDPILLDLQMVITCIKWSPDGEVLAVVGSDVPSNTKVPSSMVQLYSHTGIHLRTLRVPGTKTSAVSWEGGGLRLALAVDSYIYLANIRPEYKWAFFRSSTCVYGFRKKDHVDQSVMFWDIGTGERYCKSVIHLIAVCAAGDYSILATLGDGPEKYTLIMCNAIGSPVDSRHIKTQPLYLAMNSHHVYIWNYCSRSSSPSSERADVKSELNFGVFEEGTFHIDDFLCQKPSKRVNVEEPVSVSMDKICCMCCSEKILIVGRESGFLHQYDVEELRLEAKELIQCRPQTIELNCDSTRLSVIDMSGMLYFYDLQKQPQKYEEKHQGDSNISYGIRVPNFERKDVWNMKWADDNPNLLAVMEKGRMYILRGTEPEEPVACSAYLCSFHDLQFCGAKNGFNLLEKVDGCIHLLHPIRLRRWIQAIQLDEMMCQPEDPSISHVFNHETKSLRDTQEMVSAVDMQDAYCYVEEHSHPRLWTSLANHALHTLDLSYAEKAFVKCKNYYGIQFVKGLHIFKNKLKQKAEICVYFKKDTEAEQIYNNMDRQDLILDMRMKLGDWIMLEKLLEGESGNDALLELTWNNIGDYHADRQSWDKAAVYYSKAKKCEKLAECFYALGDWDSLGEMVTTLHKDSPLLPTLAKKFLHAGICKHAVTAFVESGDMKAAIDCCMDLNNWDLAIDLAKKHDFLKYVQNNIAKCTKYLVQIGNPLHAAQIHCKANQPLDAAKIFLQLAEQMAKIKTAPIVVKKLYVLSAIQADVCRASFDIKQDDATTCLDRLLKNAWHGAEAYHFWLLSHRHLYAGRYEQSMQVAWWLRDYDDILDDLNIYSLIALTSFLNKNYAQCSKAVKKLESLSQAKENLKKAYAQLAFSIFTRLAPMASSKRITRFCKDCGAPVQDSQTKCSTPTCKVLFRICMATGNLIVDEIALQCLVCKHHLIVSKLEPRKYCPLCHTSLEEFTTKRDIY